MKGTDEKGKEERIEIVEGKEETREDTRQMVIRNNPLFSFNTFGQCSIRSVVVGLKEGAKSKHVAVL